MGKPDVLCQGESMDGSPCTKHAERGGRWCRWHEPENVERRAQELEEQAAVLRERVARVSQ